MKTLLRFWPLVLLGSGLAIAAAAPDADQVVLGRQLLPPSDAHWLGTDHLGRDLALRCLKGAGFSFWLATSAWIAALLLGLFVGGFLGMTLPSNLLHGLGKFLVKLIYATPFLVLLVSMVSLLGPGAQRTYLALVLFAWAAPARQTYTMLTELQQSTFVIAGRAMGFPTLRLVRWVILPEVYRPVLIGSLVALPEILTIDVALSLFGVGVQPPTPSLGTLLLDGLRVLSVAPWSTFAALGTLCVLCVGIRMQAYLLARD